MELSANLWRPVARGGRTGETGGAERFPAILEMIPYGKDNWRRNADTTRGEWFAARGYALCRLDVRGTGSSGGVALDEYTADETRDGYDAVEWLAAQPWCNGGVGMWGISYGGFTAIQVATLRPPHLRAIVPVMATDDRYLDDVHYRGGCVTVSELSQYAVSQVAMNAMPPDAAFRGAGWRDEWLDAARAPRRRGCSHGCATRPTGRTGGRARSRPTTTRSRPRSSTSVAGTTPTSIRRSGCRPAAPAPSHTLVGNWVHSWPHDAAPGPEPRRAPRDRPVLRPPPQRDRERLGRRAGGRLVRARVRAAGAVPRVVAGSLAGGVGVPASADHGRAARGAFGRRPAAGGRQSRGARTASASTRSVHRPTTGTRGALSWGAGGAPNGLARDLRPDEDAGPTYTSEPLDEALEVLGVPEVVVHLEVDAPVATLSVRLSDVAPDGTSALVSAGVLNLTHRRSHVAPEPLEPGRVEEIRVPLRTAGYRWLAGPSTPRRARVSLWPVLWPSPYPATFRLHRGAATPSRLELPVIPPAGGPGDVPVPAFRTDPPDLRWPNPVAADGQGPARHDPPVWRIEEDVIAGSVTVHVHDGGEDIVPDGRRLYAAETLRMTAWDADPARAELDADVVYRWQEREAGRRRELTRIEIRAVSTQTQHRHGLRPVGPARGRCRRRAVLRAGLARAIPRRLV